MDSVMVQRNGKREALSELDTNVIRAKIPKTNAPETPASSSPPRHMTRSAVKKTGAFLLMPLDKEPRGIKIGSEYQTDLPEFKEENSGEEEEDRDEQMIVELTGAFSEIGIKETDLTQEEEKILKKLFRKSDNFFKKAKKMCPAVKMSELVKFFHEEKRLKVIEDAAIRRAEEAKKKREEEERLRKIMESAEKKKNAKAYWTKKEKTVFLSLLSIHGKNFEKIASHLPAKMPSHVAKYYGENKKEFAEFLNATN
uniref:SANT domain-containing protein n=1 Tax=Caenorhabditis tropicalis TaxID=1561998 RepID=A0A1I7UVD9_9PELO